MTHRNRGWRLLAGAGFALVLSDCRDAPESRDAPSAALAADRSSSSPSFPRAPSIEEPVVAVGTLEPARVKPGDTATLAIHVRTAPTWHIYAHDSTGTPNTPTELTLVLPPGVEAIEEWRHPPSHPGQEGGAAVLEGSFVFQRKLRALVTAGPGLRELACEVSYQACDPLMCRPPERLRVQISMEIVAR